MRRVIVRVAFAMVAAGSVGGCAISLFSDSKAPDMDADLTKLEQRMDAVEQALGPR